MRKKLAERENERSTFRGTFERFGTKRGWVGDERTVLLKDICDADGVVVCDHIWLNLTKGLASIELQPGDIVQFDARVKEYVKGYFGRGIDVFKPAEIDYKLSHPTKIKKISSVASSEPSTIDTIFPTMNTASNEIPGEHTPS